MAKRVVVTGLGALTPIGNDIETLKTNVFNGVSGAGPITKFNAEKFRTRFACELKDFNPTDFLGRADIKRTDMFTQYALVATDQAIADAGITLDTMNPFDIGVIWGTGQGGMQTFEDQLREFHQGDGTPRFSPFFVPKMIANMASGLISMRNGYMGVNYSTVSACATSNTSIMDAFNYIKWGKAKVIVTGGSECPITEGSIGGFSAMKALSPRNDDPESASRPFDPERDGFVMGEGAAALILEDYDHAKARGAKIYGEVRGAAMTADAYHISATHPDGIGAIEAMKRALNEAGMDIHDVDYINPHATSTPVGDISEMKAIGSMLGDGKNKVSVSATKSMTGHLLGAAGALEAIISILAMQNNLVPPTINTRSIDPQIPENINIVTGSQAIEKEINAIMSNTFGFGGHNATLVFGSV
ncbi:beta-ketoacyl-ACP synthase II [Balneolaceae bacterium ANBcel3]|nr:beta-ketoacyl-ACP synthase II [Balneolaceae bacterium ANBcel3]